MAKSIDAKSTFSFKQTGGFIATNKHYDAKLADLPEKEREELSKLIQESGLPTAKSGERMTGGAADMFCYDFTLNTSGQVHHMVFDDGTLPQSYRPLVKYLRDKVITEKR